MVLILIGAAGIYISVAGIPKYPVKKIDLKVEVTHERVQKGSKMVHMLCMNCHFDQKTGAMTGHRLIDVPPEFGTIYSRNITKDPTCGIRKCDLTVADAKYRNDEQLIAWIRDPSKISPGSKMPTWQGVIKEEEYPAFCSYVRKLGQDAAKRNVAQK